MKNMEMTEISKKILVFGGTTEGREILKTGIPCVYSAATEYGASLADDNASGRNEVISGRLDAPAIADLASRADISGVIDATHPYAQEARKNIASACEAAKKPLFRVERKPAEGCASSDIVRCASSEEAASYVAHAEGNALITVGSKEMDKFTGAPDFAERFFFRALPTSEVVIAAEKLKIPASNIIAMQGPFSKLENIAHLKRINAKYLVTKDGGTQGGMKEKLEAARECGVTVVLIERPDADERASHLPRGSVTQAVEWARDLLGIEQELSNIRPMFPMFVDLDGLRVLIVGGGRVAFRKASVLARCGASIKVVAPKISSEFQSLPDAELIEKRYEPGDITGARMAIAATNDRETNGRVARDAANANIANMPVNVADSPEECSFYFPSFVEHDGYVAGISSSGESPANCKKLADRLRSVWEDWVNDLGKHK